MLLKTEFSEVRNETVVLKAEITALQKLENIHPLQDILTLQQNMQSVAAKTNSLSVIQQARNQDFLVLYNETLISKQKIFDLEIYQNQTLNKMSHELDDKMSHLETQTDVRINKLQRYQNQTLIKMYKEFEHKIEGLGKFQNMTIETVNSRIDNFKKEENKTLVALQDKIANNSERVAFTGCVSTTSTRSSGYIIRFDSVKHHVGIQHLNNLTSSGKFTCEKDGLYQISTTITSFTSGARYYIYKNEVQLVRRYMSFSSSGYYHSSSAIVTLELNVSDTVWVETHATMHVEGTYSCFTVMKVK